MQGKNRFLVGRGFTLIELLVVIAIIGILAGIVLASLGSARTNANEKKVYAQIAGMRAAAELYALAHQGAYGVSNTTNCGIDMFADTSSGMAQLVSLVNYPSGTQRYCSFLASINEWAVRADYNGKSFCADSTGVVTISATQQPIYGDANCDMNSTTP